MPHLPEHSDGPLAQPDEALLLRALRGDPVIADWVRRFRIRSVSIVPTIKGSSKAVRLEGDGNPPEGPAVLVVPLYEGESVPQHVENVRKLLARAFSRAPDLGDWLPDARNLTGRCGGRTDDAMIHAAVAPYSGSARLIHRSYQFDADSGVGAVSGALREHIALRKRIRSTVADVPGIIAYWWRGGALGLVREAENRSEVTPLSIGRSVPAIVAGESLRQSAAGIVGDDIRFVDGITPVGAALDAAAHRRQPPVVHTDGYGRLADPHSPKVRSVLKRLAIARDTHGPVDAELKCRRSARPSATRPAGTIEWSILLYERLRDPYGDVVSPFDLPSADALRDVLAWELRDRLGPRLCDAITWSHSRVETNQTGLEIPIAWDAEEMSFDAESLSALADALRTLIPADGAALPEAIFLHVADRGPDATGTVRRLVVYVSVLGSQWL